MTPTEKKVPVLSARQNSVLYPSATAWVARAPADGAWVPDEVDVSMPLVGTEGGRDANTEISLTV